VQQHDALGVERAVEGEQGLIAAEEPRVRRLRHPTPASAAAASPSEMLRRISGASRCCGRSKVSGAAS
jgi:hypothetical protein